MGTLKLTEFGPTIMANAIRNIDPARFIVARDALVFEKEIKMDGFVLLVPLRLGIHFVHESYHDFIFEFFKCPFAVGIAGYMKSN